MKKKFVLLPVVIIIISLILSGVQGIIRLLVEQKQEYVQVLVNYSDVKKATVNYEESLEEVILRLKEAGVTGVLAKEQTIKTTASGSMTSWEEQGEVTTFTGAELKLLGM